jgi:hypothetical protein
MSDQRDGCLGWILGFFSGILFAAFSAGIVSLPEVPPQTVTVEDVLELSGEGFETRRIELPSGTYTLHDDGGSIAWERISGECGVPMREPGSAFKPMIATFIGAKPMAVEIASQGCVFEIDFGEEGVSWTAKIESVPLETLTFQDAIEFSGLYFTTKRIELPPGEYVLTDDDNTANWERVSGECSIPSRKPGSNTRRDTRTLNEPAAPGLGTPFNISSEGCVFEIDFGNNDTDWAAKIEKVR